jgi:hypothetical protein
VGARPETAQVRVDLVARHAPGANTARHGAQLALADQRANLVLGALKLRGKLSYGQGSGLLDGRSIAIDASRRTSSVEPLP